jgi:hypothetical protein
MKTTWTIAITGLYAACMTSCGGGKDYATDICNRLQSCSDLSLWGASTVSECIATGNQKLSQLNGSDRDAMNKAMDQCLATSDCTSFTSCMNSLSTNGPSAVNTPTSTVAATCNRLQTCGDLSLMDVTTVSQCAANANQQLNQVPSSEPTSIVQMLNECLAQSDCATFASCINRISYLITNGPSTVSTTPTPSPVQSDTYVAAICSRLQTCGDLSSVGATTVSECVASGSQSASAMTSSDLVTFHQMLSQCLTLSDCTSFDSCFGTLINQGL